MKSPRAWILWHYSDTTPRKSPSWEDRERNLFLLNCGPLYHRLMMLPAAVLVQLCVGSLYAWSVFNGPIEAYMEKVNSVPQGSYNGLAANTFYVAVGCLGTSAALFGPWLERVGPTKALLLSSFLFLAGNLLAALAVYTGTWGLLYFGYGVIGGFGLGLSYITPVSPLQKWFPDYRGVVSGMAVCGFGGGSMIASKSQNFFINALDVPWCFIILGVIYYVIMTVCSLVLRTPPQDFVLEMKAKLEQKAKKDAIDKQDKANNDKKDKANDDKKEDCTSNTESDNISSQDNEMATAAVIDVDISKKVTSNYLDISKTSADISKTSSDILHEPSLNMTLLESLRTPDYGLMYLMLASNTVAGLMIISKLADICKQQFNSSADLASTVVSVNSAFNLAGRIIMGIISDFVGRKPLFMISLSAQAIIVLCAPSMIHDEHFWPCVVCFWILSACYGGGFGLIPAFLADQFGAKNIGALHGIILTAWSLIGVAGGLTFTAVYKEQVSIYGAKDERVYDINFYWIAALVLLGVVCTPFIRTSVRDRMFPKVKGQVFCIRVYKRLLRLSVKRRFELLTAKQEEEEWRAFLRTLPENKHENV